MLSELVEKDYPVVSEWLCNKLGRQHPDKKAEQTTGGLLPSVDEYAIVPELETPSKS